MHIAIASSGQTLDAPIDARFGRAANFLIVDSETLAFTVHPNPAIQHSGGAGIAACQYLVGEGAGAVVAGQLGPNAMRVLESAGVALYQGIGGTVRDNVAACNEGKLEALTESGPAHVGKGPVV